MIGYKVLITTSGTGSRLGEVTKYTNKALVRVGKKPALSYIIEAYQKEVELVITVGYFRDHVKEFVKLAYPDRKVTFVEVDNFEGPGSSLGYSMLHAKEHLQCPFIFHACDTIVTEPIPALDRNWIAGFCIERAIEQGMPLAQYRTHKVEGERIVKLLDKGESDFQSIHIGLDGIQDYQMFWQILEQLYQNNPLDQSLSEVHVLDQMLHKDVSFEWVPYNVWLDIGNQTSLQYARKNIPDKITVLDKLDESIFIFDDTFVIKFFAKEEMVRDRVARARELKGLVPEIEATGKNFYRYTFAKGELYPRVVTPRDFRQFLEWADQNIWQKAHELDADKFQQICYDFYSTKTKERVSKFLEKKGIQDQADVINGEHVLSVAELLSKVDFDWLTSTKQSRFHGDLVLDNIIRTPGGYCLLDWRQNFGGLLQAGDMYYDLGKLNHNLTVNHDIIDANLFTIEDSNGNVTCDIMRPHKLVLCQEILHQFILEHGYDLKKVKILTTIIWLNMSPLHHHPFDLFLFYFGKLNLWKVLNQD
ncbi:MAG: hypothetical protein UX68_C0005G0036 [Parcubacteria group bacterium GW2011_GWA2_46_9]|nr:MAG: hypothetical protein UX68_C0005G0036 [Parcubacteria group bacterium GW2011_GWA2_46_9]